jgi:hypothetical protein
MNKKETIIEPELFEIQLKHWICYVVAYDMVHALESIPHYENKGEAVSIKQLTGKLSNNLYVAKECLPQGLVNKNIENE